MHLPWYETLRYDQWSDIHLVFRIITILEFVENLGYVAKLWENAEKQDNYKQAVKSKNSPLSGFHGTPIATIHLRFMSKLIH